MTIYYSTDHEWLRLDEADTATVGISSFAQAQLGDIVFVELPAVGAQLARSDSAAVVESVKAASDVYSPVAGAVTEINGELAEDPGLVNRDSEGAGWFFKVRLADQSQLDGLMSAVAYQDFCANL